MTPRYVGLLALGLVIVSCVQSAQVQCDVNGELALCGVGSVCVVGGCASPAEAAACLGKLGGEPCELGTSAGTCELGACLPTVCGDRRITGSERCDDGNLLDGDGCAANCASDERCGNGVVDRPLGETCDDGNVASGDGCQADCRVPRCGDGIVDVGLGEACDNGLANGDAPDGCRITCQLAYCGDGVKDGAETCDDGNRLSGDGCNSECRSLETCGNGVLDVAVGEACDDGNAAEDDQCRNDCTLPGCGDGMLDVGRAEACDEGGGNSNDANATCRRNCQIARCGDGVLDEAPVGRAAEVCDDGNQLDGDGCAYDCSSTEVCGNQQIDQRVGEQCDDGAAAIQGDGCSGQCRLEVVDWAIRSYVPLARAGQRVATHTQAGWVMRFGGATGDGYQRDTATFDGYRWQRLALTREPPARAYAAMAYDGANHNVVMVGGQDANGPKGDAWRFDGGAWYEMTGADAPSARTRAALACHHATRTCMLFGGRDASGPRADAWLYDGTAWQAYTGDVPPARWDHAMAYDEARGQLLVFGGRNEAGLLGDTWVWNGQLWQPQVSSPGPTSRAGHALVYDPLRGVVSLVGGETAEGAAAEQWEHDGQAWHLRTATTPRAEVSAAFDPVSRSLLLVESTRFDVLLDGPHGWQSANQRPPGRGRHGMVYDAARARVVVFGGDNPRQVHGDTWEFDGRHWSQDFGEPAPAARRQMVMVYDRARAMTILFGGYGANNEVLNDTWTYDGTGWQLSTSTAPPGRYGAHAFYDSVTQAVIMVGGRLADGGYANDTWAFDGAWRNVADGPMAGRAHGCIMQRGSLVTLEGGLGESGYLSEAWHWAGDGWTPAGTISPLANAACASAPNGSRWLQYGGATPTGFSYTTRTELGSGILSPAPAFWVAARAVWDEPRARFVLFGGDAQGYLEDSQSDQVWEYDASWRHVQLEAAPSPRYDHGLVTDAYRGEVVLFGGKADLRSSDTARMLSDTWVWRDAQWQLRSSPESPTARVMMGMAYDARRRVIVLFGGMDAVRRFGDTWEWNGSVWARRTPSLSPSARAGMGMAYDARRGRVVLFGGIDDAGNVLGDVWEWNGVAWTKRPFTVMPPSRYRGNMAYDQARQTMVLFGGIGETQLELADTWEYDGSAWRAASSTSGPGARGPVAMAYEPLQRGVVAWGRAGGSYDASVWFYDADGWRRVATLTSLLKYAPRAAYDPRARALLMVGSTSLDSAQAHLRWTEPHAEAEGCEAAAQDRDGDGLAGCADPDCWGRCNPHCPPHTTCDANAPHCGDGTCNAALEDPQLCPTDCLQ